MQFPLSAQAYLERIEKIRDQMAENSVMVMISNPPSVRNRDVHYRYRPSSDLLYITGVWEEEMAIIIQQDGPPLIYSREKNPEKDRWVGTVLGPEYIAAFLGFNPKEQAKSFSALFEDLPKVLKNHSILYYPFGSNEIYDQKVMKILNNLSQNSRGGDFPPSQIHHTNQILHELRLFKSQDELNLMQKAANISAKAHNELMRFTRKHLENHESLREYQMKAKLEGSFMTQGSGELAYGSIVATGNNATILHYEHSRSVAHGNDLVLVDAGCEWHGYASDITRTFPVNGKFTPLKRDLYQIVLEAQLNSIEKSKKGNTLKDVHDASIDILVDGLLEMKLFDKFEFKNKEGKLETLSSGSKEEVIEKKYFRIYYMHLTSHFLGLDVHDVGNYFIEKDTPRALESGMVFTVEPGLYLPKEYEFLPDEFKGIGIRIEDDIVITEKGNLNLTIGAVKTVEEIENLSNCDL